MVVAEATFPAVSDLEQRAVGGDGAVAQRARALCLQGLLGDGQPLLQEAGDRGQALVGGLQGLLRLADLIEQRDSELARLVKDGEVKNDVGLSNALLHLLAGRQAILRGGQQCGGALQRQ